MEIGLSSLAASLAVQEASSSLQRVKVLISDKVPTD